MLSIMRKLHLVPRDVIRFSARLVRVESLMYAYQQSDSPCCLATSRPKTAGSGNSQGLDSQSVPGFWIIMGSEGLEYYSFGLCEVTCFSFLLSTRRARKRRLHQYMMNSKRRQIYLSVFIRVSLKTQSGQPINSGHQGKKLMARYSPAKPLLRARFSAKRLLNCLRRFYPQQLVFYRDRKIIFIGFLCLFFLFALGSLCTNAPCLLEFKLFLSRAEWECSLCKLSLVHT